MRGRHLSGPVKRGVSTGGTLVGDEFDVAGQWIFGATLFGDALVSAHNVVIQRDGESVGTRAQVPLGPFDFKHERDRCRSGHTCEEGVDLNGVQVEVKPVCRGIACAGFRPLEIGGGERAVEILVRLEPEFSSGSGGEFDNHPAAEKLHIHWQMIPTLEHERGNRTLKLWGFDE